MHVHHPAKWNGKKKSVARVHQKNNELWMENVNHLNMAVLLPCACLVQQNNAPFVSHSHFIQLHELKRNQTKTSHLKSKCSRNQNTKYILSRPDCWHKVEQNVQERMFSTFARFSRVSSCFTPIDEAVLCHRALLLICRSIKIFITSQISRKSATGWTEIARHTQSKQI